MDEREELVAVVVRTDYADEDAWQAVRHDLEAGDRSGLFDDEDDQYCPPLIVEGVGWAGATVDDVLAAADGDEHLGVVFVADRSALVDPEHKLLAVAVTSGLDAEDRATKVEFGREFRIVPRWISPVNDNLALGNMGFEEYAEVARQDPEGAFRGLPD
ncbi:DUF6924 domain-containing protein [Micromonospora sp. NPDC003197]